VEVIGCIALGLGMGLVAGILLIVGINFNRLKMRARSKAFPKAETVCFSAVIAILAGQIFVSTAWSPVSDPTCRTGYIVAMMILFFVISYRSVMGLIADGAISDVRRKRGR
jgi:predicted Na+-dependent transporter